MELWECAMETISSPITAQTADPNLEQLKRFWKDKKVFITGNTGFKGSWLTIWLQALGAIVTGYSTPPPTQPSLFKLAKVDTLAQYIEADIRDRTRLRKAIDEASPDIVFHLAAQPLVRDSYRLPVETYEVNVMGTVYLLEAIRQHNFHGGNIRAILNVTTDKCYHNNEWVWGYREEDRLGGYDPYSSSKACSELAASAYRNSFFHMNNGGVRAALATARAGNVIGGGDWASERLVPDCLRAFSGGESLSIRNPRAIRPWQHVLEPLNGYLMLARALFEQGDPYAEAWNFGPHDEDCREAEWIVRSLGDLWGGRTAYSMNDESDLHESSILKLDCSKANAKLGWQPRWNLHTALSAVVEWHKAYLAGDDMLQMCRRQILNFGGLS